MSVIDAVIKRRDKLLEAMKHPASVGVLDGSGIGRLVEAALSELPKGCQYSSVFRTLQPLIGSQPSLSVLRSYAWAMAGNVPALRGGQVVRPGVVPTTASKAVVQFLACERLPSYKKASDIRIRYRFKVLCGPGTPGEFEVVWSNKFAAFMASRPNGLGFACSGKPGRNYQHYSTLVGLRAVLVLEYEEGKLKVPQVSCPLSLREYNKALTEMRWRSTFTCPFAFTHTCHQCPKGQESCPAAVRPLDLIQLTCTNCSKTADTDPYWDKCVCIRCRATGKQQGVRHGGSQRPV